MDTQEASLADILEGLLHPWEHAGNTATGPGQPKAPLKEPVAVGQTQQVKVHLYHVEKRAESSEFLLGAEAEQ